MWCDVYVCKEPVYDEITLYGIANMETQIKTWEKERKETCSLFIYTDNKWQSG